jgi:exonuclease III
VYARLQTIEGALINDDFFGPRYKCLWSLADKKYSGVAMLVKRSLLTEPAPTVAYGLTADGAHHPDGRVITVADPPSLSREAACSLSRRTNGC